MLLHDKAYFDSHIFLAALYFAFAIVAAAIYIFKDVWEKHSIGFLLLVIVGTLVRAVSFLLFVLSLEDIIHLDGKILDLFNVLPSFLIISGYTITLILGVIINEHSLHSPHKTMIKVFKKTILAFNIVMYSVVVVLVILDFALNREVTYVSVNTPTTDLEMTIQLFDACIYLSTPIFLILFFILYNKYTDKGNKDPPISTSQTRKRFAFVIVTSILCFVVRGVIVIVLTFYEANYWYKDLIYYIMLELLPLSFLLYIMSTNESQKYLQGSEPLLGVRHHT